LVESEKVEVKLGIAVNNTVPLYTIVDYVESLSDEDQDLLFDLMQKRRMARRRSEIAQNAAQTIASVRAGTAQRGSAADIVSEALDKN
jgi:hypothetical protein